MMFQYVLTFILGGVITTAIVYFEANGQPLISRLAALMPVFTWLSYLFIGKISGAKELSQHALFVLLGTIVAWTPYMLAIYLLAPKIGSIKSIIVGIIIFFVIAFIFIKFYKF